MSEADKKEAARQFCQRWTGRGKEDEDDHSYWIELLEYVLEADHPTTRIEFQKKVVGPDGNTKRIDAYIAETRVLIEQKSLNVDLSKPQSGHDGMTPYEQAKMYDNSLPVSEKAKWIVLSNFGEIWVYDMDMRVPEPKKFTLTDVYAKPGVFDFLVNKKEKKLNEEMEISIKAGEFVGLMYDALLKQYIHPEDENSLKSLNMLCVRLVFCLYAEDAHIFGTSGHMFHDYLAEFETKDMRRALIDLFKVLDTPEDKRDPYLNGLLAQFPYANGGLFAEENIEIPNFTDEIRDILLEKASEGFDWSKISPTIFGAVFESTLNPETRRSGGMHYTSIENIHKVIDPLFLDDLKAELEEIKNIQIEKTRNKKLDAFQDKLASLTWFDPACGSGNFLTETYISIRRLENEAIMLKKRGQIAFMDVINPIKVSISQFYGIEINDFAVTVAKTALWIAESQMMKETEEILIINLNFLPLKTNANIVEGNALRLDWEEIVPKDKLNYIMGNPPFIGYAYQNIKQKEELISLYSSDGDKTAKNAGKIDYVAGWYYAASKYIVGTDIRCAFVSTSSITQGEQVAYVWKPIFDKYDIHISFAYKPFIWNSEAIHMAHVWCVIIGFASNKKQKNLMYEGDEGSYFENINFYLQDAPNIFIESRRVPLCNSPVMSSGGKPVENGYYIFEADEKEEFIKKVPEAKKYIKRYVGSDDFIKGYKRWCLWLHGVSPNEYRNYPQIMERVEAVRKYRLQSKKAATRLCADRPYEFMEIKQPIGDFLIVPEVSGERRKYIPIGYSDGETICSNKVRYVPDATLYHFGILTSNVHMSWVRAIAGRLGASYSYSINIVYNNFPWPTPTEEQKSKIEQTAQGILDARALYPDSSLADLYDPLTMPPELQKAHQANDRAVMQAYGFSVKDTSEADCVAALMKMYQELTEKKS